MKAGVSFERISQPTLVAVGDTVKTGGGSCALLMENSTELVLQPNTVLHITEATFDKLANSRSTLLKLDMGRLKAKIGKLSQGSKFEVVTPTALAAVRGTLFYLDAGTQLGQLFTEIYVDESTGGVVFRNTRTGDEFLIPQFSSSSAFQDGRLLAAQYVPEDKRQAFVEAWDRAIDELTDESGDEGGDEDVTGGGEQEDAEKDRLSEQNISGNDLNSFIEKLLDLLDDEITIEDIRDQMEEELDAFNEDYEETTSSPEPNIDALILKTQGVIEYYSGDEEFEEEEEWTYGSSKFDEGTSPFGAPPSEMDNPEDPPPGPPTGNGTQGIVSEFRESTLSDVLDQQEAGVSLTQLDEAKAEPTNRLIEVEDLYDQSLEEGADQEALLAEAQEKKELFDEQLEEAEEVLGDYQKLLENAVDLNALHEAERLAMRAEIRRELDRIEADTVFDQRVARFEQALDAQTGKVFTDAHGYRVRVDQYIFMPSNQEVQVLSLTLRSEGPLSGISSASFGISFNRDLTESDGSLRDLPWADYLNVVTREEMMEKTPTDENSDPIENLYGQYIVHETDPERTQGSEITSALFPRHFYAEFSNPNRGVGDLILRDRIRFDEVYTDPIEYYFEGYTSPSGSYIVQGRFSESTRIEPGSSASLTYIERHNQSAPELYVGGVLLLQNSMYGVPDLTVQGGATIGTFSHQSISGSQTPGFVDDFNQPENPGLKNITYYINNPLNTDEEASPSSYNFPAFFQERFVFAFNEQNFNKALVGLFVPFDNHGNVFEASSEDGSGFEVNGLRDLISPNPLVHGGNYNLQVVFGYGDMVFNSESEQYIFTPNFITDVVITPEAINDSGAFDFVNHQTEFPASLDEDGSHLKVEDWQTFGGE